MGDCSAEGSKRATPPVTECRFVCPAAAGRHAVVDAAVEVDSILQEPKTRVHESEESRSGFRYTQQDDERTSHVVDAVPVIAARHIDERVFEDSVLVGHRDEMRERESAPGVDVVFVFRHAATITMRSAIAR
jgi:hypothetical protein